jgi:integrase
MKTRGDGRIFQRKGSVFWWCAYYLRGKEYRESTGETEEKKAQKLLGRKLKEVHADQIGAKQFITPRQEKVRVSKLLDALQDDYELRRVASPQFQSHLKNIRAHFGDCLAVALSAEQVDAYVRECLAESKPATVNRRTQLLRQAYELAIKRRHLSQAPFIRHLSEKGNTRTGFFAEEQFREVLTHLPEYLRDYCLFDFLVGWRKSEVASLGWEDVEDDTIPLRGEDSKNGEPRKIVLEGELAEVMARRKTARAVSTATEALQPFSLEGKHTVRFNNFYQANAKRSLSARPASIYAQKTCVG